jgi:hypothetical protein
VALLGRALCSERIPPPHTHHVTRWLDHIDEGRLKASSGCYRKTVPHHGGRHREVDLNYCSSTDLLQDYGVDPMAGPLAQMPSPVVLHPLVETDAGETHIPNQAVRCECIDAGVSWCWNAERESTCIIGHPLAKFTTPPLTNTLTGVGSGAVAGVANQAVAGAVAGSGAPQITTVDCSLSNLTPLFGPLTTQEVEILATAEEAAVVAVACPEIASNPEAQQAVAANPSLVSALEANGFAVHRVVAADVNAPVPTIYVEDGSAN